MADWQYNAESTFQAPIDTGYYAKLPDIDPKDRAANAYLESQLGERIYLWVYQIVASFQQGGQFAQSANRREWYGRNFAAPTFTVSCQTPNQFQASRLIEFIRHTQTKSLRDDPQNVAKFVLGKGGVDVPNMKGVHMGYSMQGHIANAIRHTERWVNVPEVQFDFIVAYAGAGIFKIEGQDPQELILKSWLDVFERGATFIEDPDVVALRQEAANSNKTEANVQVAPGPGGGLRPT